MKKQPKEFVDPRVSRHYAYGRVDMDHDVAGADCYSAANTLPVPDLNYAAQDDAGAWWRARYERTIRAKPIKGGTS